MIEREIYGDIESGYASYGFTQGWLNLLADRVLIAPFDADRWPVLV